MFVGHGRHDFERFTIQMTFVDSSGQSRPGMLTIDASPDRRNDSVDVRKEVSSSKMETSTTAKLHDKASGQSPALIDHTIRAFNHLSRHCWTGWR
jgi:hypothetical protein